MKRIVRVLIASVIGLMTVFAQEMAAQTTSNVLVIDQESYRPIYNDNDPLSGLSVDRIGKDRSNRPCVRIKIHVSKMIAEDIELLEVRPIGGNIVVMRKETAHEKNGIIVEMTANPNLRFMLYHPRLGASNVVTVNAEGDREYLIEAYAQGLQTVVLSSNVSGADVYLDEEYKGVLDNDGTLTVKGVTAGAHKLRMSYYTQNVSQDIMVSDVKIHFRVDLQEMTTVNITSEPSSAKIFVDGEYVGLTPYRNFALTKGVHEVECRKDDVSEKKVIDFTNASKDLSFDVEAVVPVQIHVPGKKEYWPEISVDGKERVDSPFKDSLKVGLHDVNVYGYKDKVEKYQINIRKGHDNTFNYPYPGESSYRFNSWISSWGGYYLIPMMTMNTNGDTGYGGMISFPLYYRLYVKYTSTFNASQFKGCTVIDEDSWNMIQSPDRLQTTSITAGIYLGRFGRYFRSYVGLGYGKRNHYKMIQNDWYMNDGIRYESWDMDFGLIANFGRFKLIAGITFPAANVGYTISNICDYAWDYIKWPFQEAWHITAYLFSMGPLIELIGEGVGDYLSGLNKIAPAPENPFKASQQKKWEWFPYNFVELNIGVGFAF